MKFFPSVKYTTDANCKVADYGDTVVLSIEIDDNPNRSICETISVTRQSRVLVHTNEKDNVKSIEVIIAREEI